jgi:hypothetical protein
MSKKRNHTRTVPVVAAAQEQPAVRHGRKPPITDTRGSDKVEIDYFRFYESLARKEIADFQAARVARHDPFNAVTYPMQQLYKDCMLDNHLRGAAENRILRVLNKEFVIKDEKGKVDPDRSRFVQTRWFRHAVRRAMESKFYGYSMLLVSEFTQGAIRTLIDIPRENILPERGLLVKEAMNPTAESIPFRMFPNFFIYIQLLDEPFGILERIAPLTIYKRHSWAAWDEFEQIFGVPIRIARTMINTQKHRDDLQKWMETMGTANYMITDKQTEIEVVENRKTDSYNVFLKKIEAINKEISKAIVGQTMTMDDGSSQSQATVHLKIYDEVTKADIMDIQDWASDSFFPVMRAYGYDLPEGFYLELSEKLVIEPKDKIEIDRTLLQAGYHIDPAYIQEFYGTPLVKGGDEDFFV